MSGTSFNVKLKIHYPSFCHSAIEITRPQIYLIGTGTPFNNKPEKVVTPLKITKLKVLGRSKLKRKNILFEEGVEIHLLFDIKLRYYGC